MLGHQCAAWLDRLATVRRSAVDQQTPSARRPAAWTCWTRQQLRRNSQVLSRNLPCLRVTLRRSSRISAGHVTGSIPGSSTEKMLAEPQALASFLFSSTSVARLALRHRPANDRARTATVGHSADHCWIAAAPKPAHVSGDMLTSWKRPLIECPYRPPGSTCLRAGFLVCAD
jgi:hypothetical protein